MRDIEFRSIQKIDKEWITFLLEEQWGSSMIVSRGKLQDASKLSGFIAIKGNKRLGLITYVIENTECEIVSLNSLLEKHGIGTHLVEKVIAVAKTNECKRVWLVETNDNRKALQFYQNRGFNIKKIHKNAIEQSRKLKPQIPFIGQNGIPIKDEIELEILLNS